MSDVAVPTICTVCFANYLPQAMVLARSLADHGHDLHLLVIDGVPETALASLLPNVHLHATANVIDDPTISMWREMYDITEQATAVKPWFFGSLLRDRSGPVVYIDPDMLALADPWPPLREVLLRAPIALTPHLLLTSQPPEALSLVLSNGVYNLGFLAVVPGAEAFIEWWKERLRYDCLLDSMRNLAVDQRWVDLAPSLFSVAIVDDPGINLGPWNTHERTIRAATNRPGSDAGEWTVQLIGRDREHPVRLAHFSKGTLRPLASGGSSEAAITALDESYASMVAHERERFGLLPQPVFERRVGYRRAARAAAMAKAQTTPGRRRARWRSRRTELTTIGLELARRYRHTRLVRWLKRTQRT